MQTEFADQPALEGHLLAAFGVDADADDPAVASRGQEADHLGAAELHRAGNLLLREALDVIKPRGPHAEIGGGCRLLSSRAF